MRRLGFCTILTVLLTLAYGQGGDEVVFLWSSKAPIMAMSHQPEQVRITDQGEHVVSNIHAPNITAFIPPPDIATGAAIVIAPGGGHRELWIDHEGFNVARFLKDQGIAAFVLKYRLANMEGSEYTVDEHAVADILKAVELVRSKAQAWNIKPDRVGVMGFSAGGEIAGLAAMIEDATQRPDFQVLMYPGRLERLKVTEESIPAFLACGSNDRPDISEHLPGFYLEFKKMNVPAEMHIYAAAGHGFGLRVRNEGAETQWPHQLIYWLKDLNFLD